MKILKLSCPDCGAKYTLKAPSLNAVRGKIFNCPKCACSAGYEELIPGLADEASEMPSRHIAAPEFSRQAARQMVNGAEGRLLLHVPTTGKTFGLSNGRYTLGRDSSDSRATVKLAPDPYMSRMHAMLIVNANQARLTNQSNTSLITLNGNTIPFGRSANIAPGDTLVIGQTEIKVDYQ